MISRIEVQHPIAESRFKLNAASQEAERGPEFDRGNLLQEKEQREEEERAAAFAQVQEYLSEVQLECVFGHFSKINLE